MFFTCITYKVSVATFLAFKEYTAIGIIPIPFSGTMTFCANFCFEALKCNIFFEFILTLIEY